MGGNIFSFVTSQSGPIAIIVAVFLVLGWAVFGLVKLAKPVRWIVAGFSDLFGEPARPGVPARPGIVERQASTDALLAQVLTTQAEHTETLKELMPNHGGSIKDITMSTHDAVTAVAKRLDVVEATLKAAPTVAVNPTTVNINPPPEVEP